MLPLTSYWTNAIGSVLNKLCLLVSECGSLLDTGGSLLLLSLASCVHLQSVDTDQEVHDAAKR